MKNKRYILSCLIIMLTGVFYFTVQAQQKKYIHRANFSGEWKSKEPISMGGNIVCAFTVGDRMNSKTMKIADQEDALTIETPYSSTNKLMVRRQEKIVFDGKENEIDYGQGIGKKFTVIISPDGQTMTINSIALQKQVIHYIKEVWKLSNDGKSIIVKSNAKSNVWGEERSWKTVFDKTNY
jgi:hypothetical protein